MHRVVIRQPLGWRVFGWLFAAVGLIFGASGLAAGDIAADILMLVFGLLCTGLGASTVLARLDCSSEGITIRSLMTRRIPAQAVSAVGVGNFPGANYTRVCLVIERSEHKPTKVRATARPDTDKNRAELEAQATQIRQILGLSARQPSLKTHTVHKWTGPSHR